MDHTHDHPAHEPAQMAPFRLAVVLNIAIVILEVSYGLVSHSMALLADAGHNLTDVLGLALAWGASYLAGRPPTRRRTYGFRRTTILASLANAILLLMTTGAIAWESILRLMHPRPIDGLTLSWVAAIAIVLNGFSAWLFMKGRKADLNQRGVFLHMVSDAAVSAGVVVAGFIIAFSGALWIDPVMSILISLIITLSTWSLLRESFNLVSDAVPENIDPAAIEDYLRRQLEVGDLHDLHIWGMSTTHNGLTVHLVMKNGWPGEDFVHRLSHELHLQYGIEHSTIQIERGDTPFCKLSPSHVI